ncbi:OadG family protein [Desulfoprunum benzoelyticum]|uniref:Na+-transporting methylmalonyl-CoA/oxaloacetate decarboxylase gamma subunit n=1 Tax=Desulfoprunum benzoelyticum TaxID=1506996 RepID=A0A840UVJ0_9BACT|nr:OadG family protein [Desulfoprunum benzoelyticum]MBB5349725.1 Na+-transporting methylmalonyl-CoA/oxaloacetate decarboxylase gamma subunit [Desulfoprunum benzoelyticum]MBM9531810.1 OadG family protein [Desulfoprunum benzoelyticum]
MIFAGLKLMVVGMTTVMLFLLLMIYFIKLVAFLTKGAAAREIQAIANDRAILASKRKKAQAVPVPLPVPVPVPGSDGGAQFAVIAAAVAAYETDMGIRE